MEEELIVRGENLLLENNFIVPKKLAELSDGKAPKGI